MGVGCTGKFPIMYISHPVVLWTCFVVNISAAIFGTFGNVLSFRILGYNKSRRNQSSTFYLRVLAIADCFALFANSFLSPLQMNLRPVMNLHPLNPIVLLVNTYPLCNIRLFLSHSTALTSVYIIVLFSIERCLVVLNPFRWMRIFTVKLAKRLVTTLGILSCLVTSPALFSFEPLPFRYVVWARNATTGETIPSEFATPRDCDVSDDANATSTSGVVANCDSIDQCKITLGFFKKYVVVYTILQYAVPLVLTGLANVVIVIVMRRRDPTRLTQLAKANDEKQDWEVTKRLIVISMAFIVLGFPILVFHCVTNLMSGSYCNVWAADALTITLCLSSVNYAINFVLYCISEDQFRKLSLSLLKCKRHRLQRLLSYVNEPKGGRNRRRTPADGSSASGQKWSACANQSTSSTQGRKCSDASVTAAAVVHQQEKEEKEKEKKEEEGEEEENRAMIDSSVTDYVLARRHAEETKAETEENKNCSIARDWNSELFAEAGQGQAEIARWSQVTPE